MNIGSLQPKGQDIIVSRYQTAAEIAGAILKAVKESEPAAAFLAPYFKNQDPEKSARLIFFFCKNAIPYRREPGTRQTAKTLPRILADAKKHGGDCKHYSITCASILKALGIPCRLRLISQNYYDKSPNHIYVVARIKGRDVIIDPVLKSFGTEARYNHKFDIKP